ncbi:MAG: hypothetical protein QNI91_11855 [Arenicellales bacterium]|nr:hypothetical protein [Arenicellales bacterium]
MHKPRNYLIPALFTFTFFMSPYAFADEEGTFFGQDATGKWIVGIKAGVMENNTEGFGDATNAGIVLGYRFSRAIGGIGGSSSVEFEATTSVSDGDISGTGSEWDVNTYALFFTYATPGKVYFKGKLGGMYSDVSSNAAGVGGNASGFSGGLGFGLKIGENGKIEAEYTGVTGDNDLSFWSLGGLYEF